MSKGIFVRCCFNFNSTYDDEAAGNYQSDDAKVKIKAYQQEHGTKLIATIAPDGTEACYNTIKDAAKITGVPYSTIHNILNKGNKGEKWGYIFKKV